jgi:hypothetical protein
MLAVAGRHHARGDQSQNTSGIPISPKRRPVPNPTPADALAITRSLRIEGNLEARRLAEQIEQACRVAV